VQPEKAWTEAIDKLADTTLDPGIRKAALELLQAGTFLGTQFAAFRADYLAALRAAAMDANADDDLRRSALDILVNLKDVVAREKLIEGLRGKIKELVPPAVALGLLARDDHGSVIDIAREVLTRVKDAHIRMQAVRILGSDPKSASLLQRLMQDKDEFKEVRKASAAALMSFDPKAFVDQAVNILRDGHDFDDIKATVKGALERAGIRVDLTPLAPPSNPQE
jgi:hypothetical protein